MALASRLGVTRMLQPLEAPVDWTQGEAAFENDKKPPGNFALPLMQLTASLGR